MGKGLKMLGVALAISTLLFSSMSMASAKGSENQTKKAKLKISYSLEGVLPHDADEALIAKLRDSGWVIQGSKMSKRILGRNYDFTINGKEIKSNEAGELEVPLSSEEEVLEFDDRTSKTKGKSKIKLTNGKTTAVERKIDFNALLGSMGDDHTSEAGHTADHNYDWLENNEKAYQGRAVHCNRFNGYHGDGKYYSDKTSYGAVNNFAQSDCDWALALWTLSCLRDYADGIPGVSTYCAGEPQSKNARCSDWADIYPWVEHARYFHQHTSPNAPIN